MTPILKPIAASFRTTNTVLELCLGDLQDEDAKKRVRNGEGPSIAWQVCHMLDHRCRVLALLGVTRESPYAAKYTAAGISYGNDYASTPEYQQQWKHINAELEAALESATPESLDQVVAHGIHGEETALESLMFVSWHEAYHMGAVGAIRKELGYPGPAELAIANAEQR
jgi:uncharacterized damage-inducible protein DinB